VRVGRSSFPAAPNIILILAGDLGACAASAGSLSVLSSLSHSGCRVGGRKRPNIILVADDHPEIIERMDILMRKARENSEFTTFWPLPEYRQDRINRATFCTLCDVEEVSVPCCCLT